MELAPNNSFKRTADVGPALRSYVSGRGRLTQALCHAMPPPHTPAHVLVEPLPSKEDRSV